MAISLTPEKRFDYVLKSDRELPPDQQTIWHLRALTHAERDHIVTQLTNAVQLGKGGYILAKADALRCGLQGWSNYRDPQGNETPFAAGPPRAGSWIRRQAVITDECLDLIPYEDWDELSDALIQCNQMTEADRKN